MNNNLKGIRFVTENCQGLYFDIKYIKFMLINDIKMKMCLHDNILEEERYINDFFIKFRSLYDKCLRFEIDSNNSVESKIKRLHEYNDITQIHLIYDDDETEICYYIDTWEGNEENIYQQSEFTIDSNLILKINKYNTLDDCINIYANFINDKVEKEIKELESLSREELIQMIKELKR